MRFVNPSFQTKAERLFLRPPRLYSWDDIIAGASVLNRQGKLRIIPAVGTNTFRAFHRLNKQREGPKATFINFFLSQKSVLLQQFAKIKTAADLHALSNNLKVDLVTRLGNIRPDQLESYNKVRKLVDLFLEHLVSMAQDTAG